jgi:hypothetical protein
MRVLLLNRYSRMGASSRLRCLQYLPYLAAQGIEVDALPLFNDRYLETLYRFGKRESANVLGCYLQRVCALLTIRKYDLLWIQYEIFPWLPEWIEKILYFLRMPYCDQLLSMVGRIRGPINQRLRHRDHAAVGHAMGEGKMRI